MNENDLVKLKRIHERMEALVSDIIARKPCLIYATTKEDEYGTVILSANTEGLARLASAMLSLAVQQKPYQHFHFDKGWFLDGCDRELVIQFVNASWEEVS